MDWLKRTFLGPPPNPPAPSPRKEPQPPQVHLDKTEQVLRLDVPTETSRQQEEASIFAHPKLWPEQMMPASLLAAKAKIFDDGLMAAVELAADQGCGKLVGRSQLLQRWRQACPSPRLGAACSLRDVNLPTESKVAALVAAFMSDLNQSKPISFYTWNQHLERVFRSDRFLQGSLPPAEAQSLLLALQQVQALEDYQAQLNLASRLTNPLAGPSLLDQGQPQAIFPPSKSVEAEWSRALWGSQSLPPGFDLVEQMIQALLVGKLTLKPSAESGWYAHQQWPLEALVHDRENLEKSKLQRSPKYQETLQKMFRSLFALTRETHIKQLEQIALACAAGGFRVRLDISPNIRVEPLVTYYLRRAESYDFVLKVLSEEFGTQGLSALRRLTPQGSVDLPLHQELLLMAELFRGCAQIACEDLGLPDLPADPQTALQWIRHWQEDLDLKQDIRCMVPLFYDAEKQLNKVLAVAGYSQRPLNIQFVHPPKVTLTDSEGQAVQADIAFKGTEERLIYPVAIEVYVPRLLNRQEFCELCNSHKTLSSLRLALEAGG